MAKLPVKEIERLIYPVSFYRNKARYVKACCEMLVTRFGGKVPSTMEELVHAAGRRPQDREPGADPRLSRASQNICVDTHVHRISNRLGWVATTLPDETEQALYRATDAAGGRTSICTW